MGNNKMIKTAAAVALGASVVATAVAPGAASAATTYKLKSGKLVNAKTGKVVKGYKVYKSTLYKDGKKAKGYVTSGKVLYKDGKKFNGLRSAKYYKAGKVATGTYKGVYYKTGVKFTGLKSGVYYKAGVKGTGVYKSVYYKAGKKGTALVNGVYYKNGAKGTGSYKGIQYKSGKAVTGVVKDVYYNNGVKATAVVDGVQYVDGDVANEVYKGVLYVAGKAAQGEVEGVLYKDGKKVTGEVEGVLYEDGKAFSGVKDGKVYVDGKLDEEAPAIEVEAAQTVAYGATAPTAASFVKSVTDNSGEKIEATATITFDGKEVSAIDTKVAGEYTINYVAVDKNGNEGKASVKVTVEATTKAEVESVTAINAKQVVVKFTKSVTATSVFSDVNAGTLNTGIFSFVVLTTNGTSAVAPGTVTGSLSTDGKELTLTAQAADANYFDGRYDFTVAADKLATKEGEKFGNFSQVLSVNDTTRPTLTGVTYLDTKTARVQFSEILKTGGTIVATYADGSAATVTPTTLSINASYVDIDLSALTAGKEVTLSFVGFQDAKGNLVTPNPVTAKVTLDNSDTVAPTVTSVTATSATSFDIKLSEKVKLATSGTVGEIKLDGNNVTSNATVDSEDPTIIHVTGVSVSADLATVSLEANAVVDYAGNPNTAFTKVVNFKADTQAPTLQSATVETISGKKYLVLTYNEAVSPVNGKNLDFYTKLANGEKAKTTITTSAANTTQYSATNNKAIKIDISSLSAATFTVDLVKGLVEDGFENESALVEGQAVGVEATQDTQEVTTIAKVDSTTIAVTFEKALDVASAETASNYSVEGSTVKKAEIYKNNGTDGYIVYLTIEKNTIVIDGDYQVTVSNVKAQDGKALEAPFVKAVALDENIAPKVAKAELLSSTSLKLTFSENVLIDANAFEVYAGTTKLATVTNTGVTASAGALTETITVPTLTAEQLAAGLTVKVIDGKVIKDIKNNALDFTSIVVAQ